MNCLDEKCNEPAEELEEHQGLKIRVCKQGHRTAKYVEESSDEKPNC